MSNGKCSECGKEALPFTIDFGRDKMLCYDCIDLDDIEQLGHCPNCDKERIYKYESIEKTASYTNTYKLTSSGFNEDNDDVDDGYDNGNEEIISNEIVCLECDFSKYWGSN